MTSPMPDLRGGVAHGGVEWQVVTRAEGPSVLRVRRSPVVRGHGDCHAAVVQVWLLTNLFPKVGEGGNSKKPKEVTILRVMQMVVASSMYRQMQWARYAKRLERIAWRSGGTVPMSGQAVLGDRNT
uniref:Uncharacterized protein n=1 Tax=Oryza punctata TaxID=4537 RepID=A0A0E0L994_ORYPU